MRVFRLLVTTIAVFFSLQGAAGAQAFFTASLGNAFGGNAPSKKTAWAISIGGGGAHGIGSELEFSETRNFFETADGVAHGKIVTLMPGIFFTLPSGSVRPYAVVGFGFIRQRTESSQGGVLSNITDDDVGYNIGGGVTFRFARSAGVRAELRRFKVRTSNGLSFNRFMVGLVLGG